MLRASQVPGAGFHPSFVFNHLVLEVSFSCTHFTDEEVEARCGPRARQGAAGFSAFFQGCKQFGIDTIDL